MALLMLMNTALNRFIFRKSMSSLIGHLLCVRCWQNIHTVILIFINVYIARNFAHQFVKYTKRTKRTKGGLVSN